GERRPARRSIRPTGFGTRKDRENRLLRTTPPRGESDAITGPAILTSESLLYLAQRPRPNNARRRGNRARTTIGVGSLIGSIPVDRVSPGSWSVSGSFFF